MDFQKPSPIKTPVTPSARNLAQRQPTYTTAGTLYNPSSSQPLQPPTRRGRSNKYNLPNGYIDLPLELLPKTDLAVLPLRGSDDRAPGYHQYSPLQQNYDRAVSPSNSPTASRKSSAMPVEGLQFQSMKAPEPATPLAFGRTEGMASANNDAESDDESDSDFGTNPLRGMTVKSLHNLASYPNPNQEKAQKALLRGAKPILQGPGMASRGNASEQHNQVRPVFPLSVDAASSNASRRLQGERRSPANTLSLDRGDVPPMRRSVAPPPGLPIRGNVPGLSGTILAAGPGAPTPLTAGPPGLRQYRPSTFESTFRALGTNNGLQTTAPNQERNAQDHQEQPASLAALVRDSKPDLGPVGQGRPGHLRTPQSNAISRVNSSLSLNLSSEKENGLKVPSWSDSDPQTRLKFKPGTDRLTEEEIARRAQEINRVWHAGAELNAFWKPTYRTQVPTFGDVTPATAHTSSFTPMNVEDAKVLTPADHAKPLLNAALATLQRCAQEQWFQDILNKYV